MASSRGVACVFVLALVVGAGSAADGTFVHAGSAVPAVSDCVRATRPSSGGFAVTTRQAALSRAVDRYGKRFPDSYSGARWYRGARRPRLAVGFTSGVKRHLADLRRLAGDPGLILVCKTARSAAELARIGAKIPHRALRDAGRSGGTASWFTCGPTSPKPRITSSPASGMP